MCKYGVLRETERALRIDATPPEEDRAAATGSEQERFGCEDWT